MEHIQEEEHRWGGKVSAELPATTADRAWSLLSDFCSLHKWLPGVHTCRRVGGDDGLPGCVRYCAGPPGDGGEPAYWAKEELLAVDPIGRSHRYSVIESNMGFGEYFAVLAAIPEGGGGGCRIEWSFEAGPVKGWTEEGLVSYLRAGVEAMAKRIEEALQLSGPLSEHLQQAIYFFS